jgi:hypothetical protein
MKKLSFILALLLVLAPFMAQANIYGSSLVGWWTLDSNHYGTGAGGVIDSSGSGNNGTQVGTPTLVAGKLGQALSFNGTSQYVDTGSWSNSLTSISVCAWVKPTSGTRQDIVSKWSFGAYQYNLLQGTTANKFTFYISITGGAAIASSNSVTTIVAGTWYHLCGTYDNSNIKLYVNGAQEGVNIAQTGNLYNGSSQDNLIGESGDAIFDGSLDDIRIYNRALTAGDVAQLYYQSLSTHFNFPW